MVILLLICCSSASGATNPYPYWQTNSDGDRVRPCTWYCWQQAYERLGIELYGALGNGVQWLDNAIIQGYQTGDSAQPDAIAVYSGGTWGHVAYVTAVNGSSMTVIEGGRSLRYYPNDGINSTGESAPSTVGSVRWGTHTLLGFIYLQPQTPTWQPVSVAEGMYYVINDGSYLSLDGAASYDPATYNNHNVSVSSGPSEEVKWQLSAVADGYIFSPIVSTDGRVLTAYADAPANGTNVNIQDSHVSRSDRCQWWKFEAVSGGYIIHNVKNQNVVLAVSDGNVCVQTRNGEANQIWSLFRYSIEPTTEEPTTVEPTTEEVTTEIPTTAEPTTEELTTDEPITEEPTTGNPTAEEPTMQEPTTETPTTEAPTTEALTSETPTSESQTTESYTDVTVKQSRDGLWYYVDHGSSAELYQYLGSGTSVTVPGAVDGKTVTALTQTFYGRSEITSVTLPDTLLEIGESAFCECSGLTELTIPDSVTSIGKGAFFNCGGLTALTVPESVESIGENALYGCVNIDNLTLPSSCSMTIGDYAFANWTKLTALTVPNGTASIGTGAFFGCSALKTLSIPDSVRSIGEHAFWNNEESGRGLETLRLPISCAMTIGEHEFMHYGNLTAIAVPEGVTSLGAHAFRECASLASVTLPSTLLSIDEGVFRDCPNLLALDIPDSVSSFADGIFDHDCILTVGQNSQARTYAEEHGLQYIIRETGEQHIDTPSSAQTVEEKVDEIVSSLITDGLSEYEIAMRLHNWLTGHANYTQLDLNDPANAWVYEPEGVLLRGEGACQSYTDAYAMLLNKVGIANTNAVSDSHTWNVVRLDGKWYHIDVTWDDPSPGGGENHDWFGLSDYALEGVSEHSISSSSPACNSYAMNYHYRNGNLASRLQDAREAIQVNITAGETEFTLQIGSWTQGDNRGLKGRTCALILRNKVFTLPDGRTTKLETSWNQQTNMLWCKAEAGSTEGPTTEEPTTLEPTTEAPTTDAPTTEELSTVAPTTEAPTTEVPTTEEQTQVEVINTVSILGITAPVVSEYPDYTVSASEEGHHIWNYTGGDWYDGVQWRDLTWNVAMTKDTNQFQAGHTYRCYVLVQTDDGYEFANNGTEPTVSAYMDGEEAATYYDSTNDFRKMLWLYRDYTIPAEQTDIEIDRVEVLDVTEPVHGAKTAYYAAAPASAHYSVWTAYETEHREMGVQWYDKTENRYLSASDTFATGHVYEVSVYLIPDNGYVFALRDDGRFDVEATLNGDRAEAVDTGDDTEIEITYSFTCVNALVSSVSVSFEEPAAGWEPDWNMAVQGEGYRIEDYTGGNYINGVCWRDDTEECVMRPGDLFVTGHTYAVTVSVVTIEGYEFGDYRNDELTVYLGGVYPDDIFDWGEWKNNIGLVRIFTLTTEGPTTETPTTETPTTEQPTTEAPTTEAPTTAEPTTEEPTTQEPTTEAPMTEAPTTIEPITELPTTEEPTTEKPTTESPTTEAPTTEAPTTEVTTTEAPTTETPTTEAPTTEETTTETSTTEAVTTEAPTTEEQTTEAPTTEVTTTEAPTTEVPATEAPTNEAPTTEAYGQGTHIDASHFPDVYFRVWIITNADRNGDSVLSEDEIEAITEMDVSGLGIMTLEGIANFTNLKRLNCSNNDIVELHVEKLQLESLTTYGNAPNIRVYSSSGVSVREPGDADGNGSCTIEDAMCVLQFVCGWDVTMNESNADVNADGKTDMQDALLILKYADGQNVKLQ